MTKKISYYEAARQFGDRLRELDSKVSGGSLSGSDLVKYAREEVSSLYHQWMAIHPDREMVLLMTEEE